MHELIGIYANAMGSGKSEVARVLSSQGFANVPFAGPLKEACRTLLRQAGYDEQQAHQFLFTPVGKETPLELLGGITPRRLMQELGSWGRRVVPGGIWLRLWAARVKDMRRLAGEGGMPSRLCVDDLRYPDEMEELYRLGGVTLRVDRPGIVVTEDHESERDWTNDPTPGSLGRDWILTNDGSLEQLQEKTLAWLKELV